MRLFLIFLFLITINCSTNKVSNNHGYKSLDKKYSKIQINKDNKNDVISKIGPPSTKSDFNTNKWFYIERKKTNQDIKKIGMKTIDINNILIVEFSSLGILEKKELLDKSKMNDVEYVKSITTKDFKKSNFLFNLFSSLREKMNQSTKWFILQ